MRPHFSTPERDQNSSSEANFESARESLSPSPCASRKQVDVSPGTAANPINVEAEQSEELPSFSSTDDDEEPIPAPKICDINGKKYEWDSLKKAFKSLQSFTKENGFAVKKHTRKMKGTHVYIQYINCVYGGQRNTTKVLTLNRKRRSRSLIGDKPCPFRACLRENGETNL